MSSSFNLGELLVPATYGMVSRLVWMVLKPRSVNERVKYVPGGLAGVWKTSDRRKSGLFLFSMHSFFERNYSPQIVVPKTLPQQPRRDGLSIVHRSFPRVFANETVNNDSLLSEQL